MNTYYLCHLSEFIAGEMDNRRQQKKLEIYYGKENQNGILLVYP